MFIREQDYLMHYGVLGMKWGVRRAAAKDPSVRKAKKEYKQIKKEYNKAFYEADSKRIAAYSPIKKHRVASKKRWEDAIDKAQMTVKAERAYKEKRAAAERKVVDKMYSKQNKNANRAIANMSTGKAIGQSMLLGSFGALKYNEARGQGKSRGRSAVEGILWNSANNITLGMIGNEKYLRNRSAR